MIKKLGDYLKDRRALFGKEYPGPFGATDRRKWESAMGFLLRTLSDMERDNAKGVYEETIKPKTKKSEKTHGKTNNKGK